ncbi:MAG: hypothetical protein QM742_08395 [Aquabacterium sp.]
MSSRRSRTRSAGNLVKLMQLGTAVPQVVSHRMARMALAGPVLSARDQKEFTAMVVEKQVAFANAWFGMASETLLMQQRMMWACWSGRYPSASEVAHAVAAKGIAPIHRKAVSNAKRLARTRLK